MVAFRLLSVCLAYYRRGTRGAGQNQRLYPLESVTTVPRTRGPEGSSLVFPRELVLRVSPLNFTISVT